MKIKKLEAWPVTMPLSEPYSIAYETYTEATNIFVRMETDTGVSGYGCAAPDEEVTGETSETVMQAITNVVEPLITGMEPFRHAKIMALLKDKIPAQKTACAAIDMALYDIIGKAANLPLWKMLG